MSRSPPRPRGSGSRAIPDLGAWPLPGRLACLVGVPSATTGLRPADQLLTPAGMVPKLRVGSPSSRDGPWLSAGSMEAAWCPHPASSLPSFAVGVGVIPEFGVIVQRRRPCPLCPPAHPDITALGQKPLGPRRSRWEAVLPIEAASAGEAAPQRQAGGVCARRTAVWKEARGLGCGGQHRADAGRERRGPSGAGQGVLRKQGRQVRGARGESSS